MVATNIEAEGRKPADIAAIYRAFVEACTARGLTQAQIFEAIDTGTHLPASLGRIPSHVFERCESEKSSDPHIANNARRTRLMRTAKALVDIYCEQTRVSDIATGARGLARLIAQGARLYER